MTVDLGVARAVDAQAFGEPGGRTFRLRVIGANSQAASLWLEKEHLRALALAFRELLSRVGFEGPPRSGAVLEFPEVAEHDFRVGTIGIGFNTTSETVVLQLMETGKDESDALLVQLTLDHSASLAEQLDAIVAAGRPICRLCGMAIDVSGHVCVRSNGHRDEPVPEADAEEGD